MTLEAVVSSSAPNPSGAYSQAVAANGFLFVAGAGPYDPVTRAVIGHTIGEQTRQVMRNIEGVLVAAGLGFGDVVSSTVYLASLERDFAEFDAAYSLSFKPPFPARITTGAVLKNILVEIAVIAAYGGQQ